MVAATIQTNRKFLFDSEGSYNGHEKWAPLKFRRGMALSDTGALRNSMAPPAATKDRPAKAQGTIVRYSGGIENATVLVGTSLAYAPIHNYGGVIRPKNKPVLWIPLPAHKDATKFARGLRSGKIKGPVIVEYKGKIFLLAKKVTIPARPFGQEAWNEHDSDEVAKALESVLAKIFA